MKSWHTKHFTYEEMTVSDTAARKNISNWPPADINARLKDTAEKMDAVRDLLGKPVLVTSGYRSPALNKAIGGSNSSHHTQGYAVDFTSPGFGTPLEVARKIRESGIQFDQIIHEFGNWVHISFAPSMRKQCLTALKEGRKTVYRDGLF